MKTVYASETTALAGSSLSGTALDGVFLLILLVAVCWIFAQ